MFWYLVHTKPKQELCALQNLQQQGFQCYLPVILRERLVRGALTTRDEPLFPRYLFIRLGQGESARSWSPIRSTRGVSRLVVFGTEPAKVDDSLIAVLQANEQSLRDLPAQLFNQGERVRIVDGAFASLDGIYQMAEGERRVMVLIELLSKSITVRVAPASLRKIK